MEQQQQHCRSKSGVKWWKGRGGLKINPAMPNQSSTLPLLRRCSDGGGDGDGDSGDDGDDDDGGNGGC